VSSHWRPPASRRGAMEAMGALAAARKPTRRHGGSGARAGGANIGLVETITASGVRARAANIGLVDILMASRPGSWGACVRSARSSAGTVGVGGGIEASAVSRPPRQPRRASCGNDPPRYLRPARQPWLDRPPSGGAHSPPQVGSGDYKAAPDAPQDGRRCSAIKPPHQLTELARQAPVDTRATSDHW